MNKKLLLFSFFVLATAGIAFYFLLKKNHPMKQIRFVEKPQKKFKLRFRKTSSKISRFLLKILNSADNNRLLFIEVSTKNKKIRENVLQQLEHLKTEEPDGDLWIADFYKQTYSRDDIIVLANKKAIYYLSTLEEVLKVKVSTRNTITKILGKSLSKLSQKYPSLERYFFEPMLDIYAPLKETEKLTNFGIVSQNQLYRGGMPVGEHTYDQLVNLGVKTVVNLKIEDSAVEFVSEQNSLMKRDITLHYLPLPNVAAPTMLQALEFLSLVYNIETKPVFVHCHRGADRTGIMAAVYRITQGHSASWSLVEAEKFNIASNFHEPKIEFVYQFEKQWLKWKEENKIPSDLTNFDFLLLVPEDDNLDHSSFDNDSEKENLNL